MKWNPDTISKQLFLEENASFIQSDVLDLITSEEDLSNLKV